MGELDFENKYGWDDLSGRDKGPIKGARRL